MQHPPWRQMAESFLKHEESEMYREMKRDGTLRAHLDERAEQARATYENLVNRRLERRSEDGAFAHQSAQEIVVRNVLWYQT